MGKVFAVMAGGGMLAVLCTGCPPAVNSDAAVADSGTIDTGAPDGGRADARLRDSGGPPCGNLTALGACQGSTLQQCDTQRDQIVTFDCSTIADGVTCGLTDCDDDPDTCWGHDCVTGSGGDCNANFGAADSIFCDINQGLGCVDGTCQPSPECSPTTFVNSCNSNTLRECWSGRESTTRTI